MRRAGPYQIQAAISALHCQAPHADDTDWPQIVSLYGELQAIEPTPVVALNRAVAVAMAESPAAGLELLDDVELASTLDAYHLYHAARADLLRRAGRNRESSVAYTRALKLASNEPERMYLERRLREAGG
jgi:RNA polymerase sigma-70 factor (ECF subfamily)